MLPVGDLFGSPYSSHSKIELPKSVQPPQISKNRSVLNLSPIVRHRSDRLCWYVRSPNFQFRISDVYCFVVAPELASTAKWRHTADSNSSYVQGVVSFHSYICWKCIKNGKNHIYTSQKNNQKQLDLHVQQLLVPTMKKTYSCLGNCCSSANCGEPEDSRASPKKQSWLLVSVVCDVGGMGLHFLRHTSHWKNLQLWNWTLPLWVSFLLASRWHREPEIRISSEVPEV